MEMTWITGILSAGSSKVVWSILVDALDTPSVVLKLVGKFLTSEDYMFVDQALWVFGYALTNN